MLVQTVFATYINQEPYVRDLVQAYLSSDSKTVLELFTRSSVHIFSYIHLAIHPYFAFVTAKLTDSVPTHAGIYIALFRPDTTSISILLHMYPN